jgi:hypothetical protein
LFPFLIPMTLSDSILAGYSANALPRAVTISHVPSNKELYIGSPAIVKLGNGCLVAAHDYFGPQSTEQIQGVTEVFASGDGGVTWVHISRLPGAFWSSLFIDEGALYLLGTTRYHGHIAIRRSTDGGHTWSEPCNAQSGLLRDDGEFHTAPVPVIVHRGRIWRAVEDAGGGAEWGFRYRPMMMSAPCGADLLDLRNWRFSNYLNHDRAWLSGKFGGWLEGNACITPEGKIANILRVDYAPGGKAAWVDVSPEGDRVSFDPSSGFFDLPGAATKFTIRRDEASGYYYSMVNEVEPRFSLLNAALTRNALVLVRSPDLRHWESRGIVAYHPDREQHGFQYADWIIDGADLLAVVRTAGDDTVGMARKAHDANFLTFHRLPNFRDITGISS